MTAASRTTAHPAGHSRFRIDFAVEDGFVGLLVIGAALRPKMMNAAVICRLSMGLGL